MPRASCSTFSNLRKTLDILFYVDYYRLINKPTAKEKPMTDILETFSDENLREIEAVEDYE